MKAKEKKQSCYENYPLWMVIISNFTQFLIYLIGAFIFSMLGIIWLVIYLIYIIFLEIRLLKKSCVNCYYYGKYCAFGKGKLARLFFKKGDTKKFIQCKITWKDIVPEFLVSIVPIIIGIILLIINFNWWILVLIILLIILISFGNGFVRGKLACKFCKQKNLGCPAEQLFNKGKKKC